MLDLTEINNFFDGLGLGIEHIAYINTNSRPTPLKCSDKAHKGKLYYIATPKNITVRTHKHGGVTLGSLVANSDKATKPLSKSQKLRQVKLEKKAALKAEREATAKKNSLTNANKKFQSFQSVPIFPEQTYLYRKNLLDISQNISGIEQIIRHGEHAKYGNVSAVKMLNAETGQFAGVQYLLDRPDENSGSKIMHFGTIAKNACVQFGTIETDSEILFCEGIADAIVLHNFHSLPVVCCMNAGNIDSVASSYKAHYPKNSGVILCDNNKYAPKNGNTGVLKGVLAATNSQYQYVIPEFLNESTKPSDVWDLWNLQGNQAVIDLLDKAQDAPTDYDTFKLPYLNDKARDELVSDTDKLLNQLTKTIQKITKGNPYGLSKRSENKILNGLKGNQLIDNFARLKTDDFLDIKTKAHEQVLSDLICDYQKNIAPADYEIDEKYFHFDDEYRQMPAAYYHAKILIFDDVVGGGKTWFTKKKYLEAVHSKHQSVLVLTSSAILAGTWAGVGTAPINMQDYRKIKSLTRNSLKNNLTPVQYDYISACLMSLLLPALNQGMNPNPELIIIDEFVAAIIQTFYGGLLTDNDTSQSLDVLDRSRSRADMLTLIQGLFQGAKKVVLMQYGITRNTIAFLNILDFQQDDIFLIRNTRKKYSDRKVKVTSNKSNALNHIHEMLEQGEKVAIPCNTVRLSSEIYAALKQLCPQKNILLVNKDTENNEGVQKFLKNPDKEFESIDALIYTPIIREGVSFTNYFVHNTVGFFDSTSPITPNDCIQMQFRNRCFLNMWAWVDAKQNGYSENPRDYINEGEAILRDNQKFVMDANGGHIEQILDDNQAVAHIKLRAEILAQQAHEKNNYAGYIYAGFADLGFEIEIENWTEKEKSPVDTKEISEQCKDSELDGILGSDCNLDQAAQDAIAYLGNDEINFHSVQNAVKLSLGTAADANTLNKHTKDILDYLASDKKQAADSVLTLFSSESTKDAWNSTGRLLEQASDIDACDIEQKESVYPLARNIFLHSKKYIDQHLALSELSLVVQGKMDVLKSWQGVIAKDYNEQLNAPFYAGVGYRAKFSKYISAWLGLSWENGRLVCDSSRVINTSDLFRLPSFKKFCERNKDGVNGCGISGYDNKGRLTGAMFTNRSLVVVLNNMGIKLKHYISEQDSSELQGLKDRLRTCTNKRDKDRLKKQVKALKTRLDGIFVLDLQDKNNIVMQSVLYGSNKIEDGLFEYNLNPNEFKLLSFLYKPAKTYEITSPVAI